MNHTPGPWTFEPREDRYLYPGEQLHTLGVFGADGTEIICTDSGVYPPTITDAQLIVAAPDLLAAIEKLLSFDEIRYAWDAGPPDEGWQSDELLSALAACDSAIEKARAVP